VARRQERSWLAFQVIIGASPIMFLIAPSGPQSSARSSDLFLGWLVPRHSLVVAEAVSHRLPENAAL
jgi:hypothetical protein